MIKQGNIQEALIELNRAKYINSNDPKIYKNLIGAYTHLDDMQKLIDTYLTLSHLTPNDYYVYYNLGNAYASVKEMAESNQIVG